MLCFSLALLGGVLLHDTARARMSFAMAASEMVSATGDVSVAEEGEICPACAPDDAADEVACDFDCTAPALSTTATPQAVATTLHGARLTSTVGISLRGLDLGVDPTPPRSTILS